MSSANASERSMLALSQVIDRIFAACESPPERKGQPHAIGSIAESCEADEQKPDRTPEIPCESCQGEGMYTGEHVYLCEDCRDKLARYDLEHHDLRMTALRVLSLWRITVAGDTISPRQVQFLRNTLDLHLAAYLPGPLRADYQAKKLPEEQHEQTAAQREAVMP